MHILTPFDICGPRGMERFTSDEACAIVQRILKNSEEAAEKMAAIKAEIDKAAENFKQI